MAFQPFTAIPQNQAAYAPTINAMAQRYGMNPLFISSVINAESSGNPNAQGPETRFGRARGLMQFMPATYEEIAQRYNIRGTEFNPNSNIEAGAAYLSELRDEFGSDSDALMAYNWGPGNVRKWIKGGRNPREIPEETQNYVAKVLGYAPSSLLATGNPGKAVEGMGADADTANAAWIASQQADAGQLPPIPDGGTINALPPVRGLQEPSMLAEGQAEQAAMRQAGGPQVNLGTEPDLTMQTAAGDLLNPGAIPAEPGIGDRLMGFVGSKAGQQALLDAGSAMLAASGWSDRPISTGQALGMGLQAGSKGYRETEQQGMQDKLVQAKIDEMERGNASMAQLRSMYGTATGGGTVQTASGPAGAGDQQAAKQQTFRDTLTEGERIMYDAADATGDPTKLASTVASIQEARISASDKAGKNDFEYADKLRDDYKNEEAVKSYRTLTRNYNEIQRVMKSKTRGGIQDTSMLFNFIKILDPGAAVQEGDKASVENMAPAAQKWAMLYNKILDEGGSIPEPMRRQIADISQRIHGNAQRDLDEITEQYGGIADSYGIDRGKVILSTGSVEDAYDPAARDAGGTGDGTTMVPYAGDGTTEAPAEAAPPPENAQELQRQLDELPVGTVRDFGPPHGVLKRADDGKWYPVGGE